MKKLFAVLAVSAVLLPAFPTLSLAQRFEDHWHGDINHFHDQDFDRWRQGNWTHGPHNGRDGWWWVIGDSWYFYPAPVYPYPDPYLPPTAVASPTPGAYWYYCRNPQGYYPYVSECFGHWRRVAATAVAAPQTVIVQQAPTAVQQPPAQIGTAPSLETPEQDTNQLNVYSAQLSEIDPGPHAFSKLQALRAQVEVLHEALYHRSYNAVDVMKNTEDLEKRIDAEKAKMLKKYGAPVSGGVSVPVGNEAPPPAPMPGYPPTPLAAPPQ